MEEQKYYWVLFEYESSFGIRGNMSQVFLCHPLSSDFTDFFKETLLKLITVLNWKEITKEEYYMALNS